MKGFKKFLDILIGITALVLIAGLIVNAFNVEYKFAGEVLWVILIKYPLPILAAVVCIRFTCDKTVWLILTMVFVAIALWIYFDPGFFGFMHSIFG